MTPLESITLTVLCIIQAAFIWLLLSPLAKDTREQKDEAE